MNYKLIIVFCCLLFGISSVHAGDIADPMVIGVGARAMGMGKAYIAIAEDADSLFVNPAGIASIQAAKATSMYANLLNDVNYTLIGGAYPIGKKSAFGAGLINSSSSDIVLRDSIGTVTGSGSWGNSVAFVSYGRYLNDIPVFSKVKKDVLVGASLKYYSVGGNGESAISNANGSGMSADLGAIYPATDALNLGAVYQNILGGNIKKANGNSDTIPSAFRVGAKANLIGKEGKAYSIHAQRKLLATLDYDLMASEKLTHIGLEFWPGNNLALRVGMDGSDPTAGLGLRFKDVEFNYAYHPYANISDNNTHFFSISYLGEPTKRVLHVDVDKSMDKTVTYSDQLDIKGKVVINEGSDNDAPKTVALRINGKEVALNADLSFNDQVALETFGKNVVKIEVSDASGAKDSTDIKVVRLINFSDVPQDHWAKKPIEETGTLGLVNGYPDKTFKPGAGLTRAEIAALLVRAKGLDISTTPKKKFKDVSASHWAAKYIYTANKAGLIKGYPDGSFKPNQQLTKAESIAIMARFEDFKTAKVSEKPYWDVANTHWAAKYIQAAKEAGMIKFAQNNKLKPNAFVNRSEAVDMLSKTNVALNKINSLYAWETNPLEQAEPATLIGFNPSNASKIDVILVEEFKQKPDALLAIK